MRSVLISTYEMGRQPFGLGSAAAWLRAAGWAVACVDAAQEKLREASLVTADLIGFHLPMHTATRLAAPIIATARRVNPSARICVFGLYGPLNADWLRSLGVDDVLGGEFEEDLAGIARSMADGRGTPSAQNPQRDACSAGAALDRGTRGVPTDAFSAGFAGSACNRRGGALPRIHFLVPDRSTLPPLSKYATLQMPDKGRRLVGYTEASRGCLHLCRHCPVVPVYQGQFRVVQPDIVLADVAAQIAAGAEHITFGDPDFFNGPTHAMRIVSALHEAYPSVSYDVTIKVEHLLRHGDLVRRLADTGCAFVTSAVESIDDRVLALLDKGHTRADFVEAVSLCRQAGVTLVPTFVAFHPWLTPESYCELVDTIERLDLVEHVSPIQLALRLLIPAGSGLLALDEMRVHIGPFDPATLTHRWTHPDPRVDALQRDVMALVGMRLTADRRMLFDEVSALAHSGQALRHSSGQADARPARDRATVPYLNEPWYC
jgi:radical SAM superfamily enzyme YgiQ (UPF0313 family)